MVELAPAQPFDGTEVYIDKYQLLILIEAHRDDEKTPE